MRGRVPSIIRGARATVVGLVGLAGMSSIEASAFAEGPSSLRFKIPDGWVDLSPGAPKENFVGVSPELIKAAQSPNFSVTAMDLAHGNDGFVENMNVVPSGCPGAIDQAMVDKLASVFSDEIAREAPGSSLTTRSKSLVQIDGVNVARFENEVVVQRVTVRQLVYFIPGGADCATITYSSAPDTWATYLPVFDASAKATTGVVAPRGTWDLGRIGQSALLGGVMGLLVAIFSGTRSFLGRKKT